MLAYLRTWLELKYDHRAISPLEFGLTASVVLATITVGALVLANNMSSGFSR